MNQDHEIREMALRYFGHGRWSALYWFIGPEPGQAPDENNDLKRRTKAWRFLGGGELNDCPTFHGCIGEKRWHRETPPSLLQPTWRPLMLLLMTYLEEKPDNDSLRSYQRDKWGTLNGETCVIELSGLAAQSFKVPRDRECFREERIKIIRERMLQYEPELVVMYRESEKLHWEAITGQSFPAENILKLGPTIIALTRHPVRSPNDYWKKLGERLRHEAQSS